MRLGVPMAVADGPLCMAELISAVSFIYLYLSFNLSFIYLYTHTYICICVYTYLYMCMMAVADGPLCMAELISAVS